MSRIGGTVILHSVKTTFCMPTPHYSQEGVHYSVVSFSDPFDLGSAQS
ncbi:hypothetical protein C8J33_12414 [Rhizobium sp. PP-CC-3G-465]|nr:hypothetical protein C8J33_12414 [Rhizobium sp. PP-CC-3G-465]